jgi:hypothetical protein
MGIKGTRAAKVKGGGGQRMGERGVVVRRNFLPYFTMPFKACYVLIETGPPIKYNLFI